MVSNRVSLQRNIQIKSFTQFLLMSEESQYSEHPGGWIEWFCAHEDHQFLCEVDEEFIKDPMNQFGLRGKFRFFNEAITMILQPQMPEDQDLEDERFLEVYQEASDIYGLLHARFIFTVKGAAIMRERFLQGKFGYCPRIYCEKQHVIPIGLCEDLKASRVKVFCPRCEEVYLPKKKCTDVDGAYFGRSFPQFLLMTFPDILPKYQLLPETKIKVEFEPTLYGFKIAGKQGSKVKKQEATNHYSPNPGQPTQAPQQQSLAHPQQTQQALHLQQQQQQQQQKVQAQPPNEKQQKKKKKNK